MGREKNRLEIDGSALMVADLARSGLPPDVGEFYAVTASDVAGMGGPSRPGYFIVYPGSPAGSPFFRVRFLDGAQPRYWQPPGTGCRWYVPALAREVLDAPPDRFVVITEGEKKALRACQARIPTVGIGGVDNWKSPDDMEGVAWNTRRVLLVYDSDYDQNVNIRDAATRFSRHLSERGATVRIFTVPPDETGRKRGLDDWLEQEGDKAVSEALAGVWVPNGSTRAVPEKMEDPVVGLNERMIYVRDVGAVFDLESDRFFRSSEWMERTANQLIGVGGKSVPAYKYFISHPSRREVRMLAYRPGSPREVDGVLNLWKGFPLSPRAGDIAIFEEFLAWALPMDAERKFFLDWCAGLFQRPTEKPHTAILIMGAEGVGKSLLAEMLERVIGPENTAWVSEQDLTSRFNSRWAHKHLVVGEEITGVDSRKEMDRIKALITQKSQVVEEKFSPSYVIEDSRAYIFLSNHALPLLLSDSDRRFFALEFPRTPRSAAFYRELASWAKNGGGAALMHALLTRDLEAYSSKDRAPVTDTKQALQAESRTDFELFLKELVSRPECTDLWTAEDLRLAFDPLKSQRPLSSKAIFGSVRQILSGTVHPQVWIAGRGNVVVSSLKHAEKWKKASSTDWSAYYTANPPKFGRS